MRRSPRISSACTRTLPINLRARCVANSFSPAAHHVSATGSTDRDSPGATNPLLSPTVCGCHACAVSAEEDYIKVPKSIFKKGLDKMLSELTRAPTRRHAGTRLRASQKIPYPSALLAAELSTSHGLPRSSSHSAEVGTTNLAESVCVFPTGAPLSRCVR